MGPFFTRRQIAALIAAAPLMGQVTTTPPSGSPAPAKPSATPEERLSKANADVRKVSARLAQIEVPMDLEPAFLFRA